MLATVLIDSEVRTSAPLMLTNFGIGTLAPAESARNSPASGPARVCALQRDRGGSDITGLISCDGALTHVRLVRHKPSRLRQSRSIHPDLVPKRCAPAGGIRRRSREIFWRWLHRLPHQFPF